MKVMVNSKPFLFYGQGNYMDMTMKSPGINSAQKSLYYYIINTCLSHYFFGISKIMQSSEKK